MTIDQLLDSIGCDELEQAFRWIDSVEVVPIISAGGVRPSEKISGHFIVCLNDYHASSQELLETFVHEILHTIISVSFPLADHEEHHPKIREVSAHLAAAHRKRIRFLLSRHVSDEPLRAMI